MSEPSVQPQVTEVSAAAGACALITGGAGFIGSHLVALLRGANWVVHTASRRPTDPAALARHWQIDLTDTEATRSLVKTVRPDYVFHLASHVWGAPDLAHVLPTFHSNLHTTVNLLTAIAEVGGCRRFVLTGSLVEPEQRSSKEVPPAPYAAAKWASSDYVRMFHTLYGVPGSIARVFMVYGPGQHDDSKLVPYVTKSVLSGVAPSITSGRRLIDWVYVDDVASGLARIALAPPAAGQSVDLGSGSLISISELVDKLCGLLGGTIRPIYGALRDRPMEPTRSANTDETRRMLGWWPQTNLEDGLRRTIDWYRVEPTERLEAARHR